MRQGTPPTQKVLDPGMPASLSSDVESAMTADMFAPTRSLITLQRMFCNEMARLGKEYPQLLSAMDAIRFATVNGARGLRLEYKTDSLRRGKDADIILFDANTLNVTPLNHVAGAVVTLMERSNAQTVLDAKLVTSHDHLFEVAEIEQDLFR